MKQHLYVTPRTPHPGALQNYLSTDYITRNRQTTSGTFVPALRQSLRHAGTTKASLTGAARIHRHQLTPSVFSLVRDFGKEGVPAGIKAASTPAKRTFRRCFQDLKDLQAERVSASAPR